MKRTLAVATMLGMMCGGVAFAGHGHGGGGHGHGGGGGPVVRDHRSGGGGGGAGRVVVRDHRSGGNVRVRVTNGRYVFPGGVVRVYKRPRIERYYDVHVRPPLVVESYDPVAGYVWVSGGWSWGGSEWIWTPGYWAVAEEPVVTAPAVSGGVTISGGISIH